MKNGEVLKLYETLCQFANDPTQKFNIKLSYTFAKNKEKMRSEAILIYQMRQKILAEYGTLETNGDIIIPKDKIEETNQKINELMEMENDLILTPIPLEWLEDYELSVEQVEALMPMLEDVEFTGPPIYED